MPRDALRMRSEEAGWGTISKKLGIPESTLRDHVRRLEEQTCGKGAP
ncbi:MAG: winged helix-turn-helix domain-containing protein [Candidatus Methanomethylophilaceae archaeon]|nr:winged helix-turn-helix domain-containing protein [Candidatus Methanomethylophilaceae archaeon]